MIDGLSYRRRAIWTETEAGPSRPAGLPPRGFVPDPHRSNARFRRSEPRKRLSSSIRWRREPQQGGVVSAPCNLDRDGGRSEPTSRLASARLCPERTALLWQAGWSARTCLRLGPNCTAPIRQAVNHSEQEGRMAPPRPRANRQDTEDETEGPVAQWLEPTAHNGLVDLSVGTRRGRWRQAPRWRFRTGRERLYPARPRYDPAPSAGQSPGHRRRNRRACSSMVRADRS
jgi:hypothetical protein